MHIHIHTQWRLVDLYIYTFQLTGYATESIEKNKFAALCE